MTLGSNVKLVVLGMKMSHFLPSKVIEFTYFLFSPNYNICTVNFLIFNQNNNFFLRWLSTASSTGHFI